MHLSEKDNQQLLPIISRLSNKYVNGVTFPPHISVNDPAKIGLYKVKKVAIESVKGISKFKVELDSIQYSDKWSKTLYIQIKDDTHLTKTSERLNKTFRKNKTPYPLNPHISLLYKEGMSVEDKKMLVKRLILPKKYVVTSIAVVTPGNINNWRDYGNWKIVFEKELK